MSSKSELAIYGGPSAIDRAHPHWNWPPKSEGKNAAVIDYLNNPVFNKKGYPAVVEAFETKFGAYHGVKHVLSTNAGTSALHAAFFAVGLGPGDELIAPTMTFIATATPVTRLGATPVFCDCEPDTGNIDPADIRRKITSKTKAIVITHLCGHPCDMDPICEIAREHGLALIEDCSHAHGSIYNGKLVGTFGDIACFSLGQKILWSGEAGVLITDNQEYFERALLVSDLGARLEHDLHLPENRRYAETGLGLKCRMNPMSAAVLNYEFDQLDKYIGLRKEKLDYFSDNLAGIPGLAPPVTREGCTMGGYYSYRPFYKAEELNGLEMDTFMTIMRAEGMELRRSNNPPLHLMPLFIDNWPDANKEELPISVSFFNSTLSMPTFTFEPLDVIDEYVAAFRKVCTHFATSNETPPTAAELSNL